MENLEKNQHSLADLQSDSIAKIMPDLIKAIGHLDGVKKSKQGYGYKYAELADVLEMCRPVLLENNLACVQLVHNNELVTTIYHTSGEWLRSHYPLVQAGVKGANNAQQTGAALTYARRYALTAMLFIAQEDDDAACLNQQQNRHPPAQQRQPAPLPASQIPPQQAQQRDDVFSRFYGKVQATKTVAELDELRDKSMDYLHEKLPQERVALCRQAITEKREKLLLQEIGERDGTN